MASVFSKECAANCRHCGKTTGGRTVCIDCTRPTTTPQPSPRLARNNLLAPARSPPRARTGMRNALPVPGVSARGAHGGAHAVEREAADAGATAVTAARLDVSVKKSTGQYWVR